VSSNSGYAFSFDPQTTAAESYIASHSISASSSAIAEAEHRQRLSREDSRASDFSGTVVPVEDDRAPENVLSIEC